MPVLGKFFWLIEILKTTEITCSPFFAMSIPKVLLKNELNSGFSGGSCSKKAYNFCKMSGRSTNRSIVVFDISAVRISQATFECLKRIASGISVGGSVTINSTSSSNISARCKLQGKLVHQLLLGWRVIYKYGKTITITIESNSYFVICIPEEYRPRPKALWVWHSEKKTDKFDNRL